MKVEKIILPKDREPGGHADRIHVAMSPAELDEIWVGFMDLAVKVDSYSDQTKYRKLKEFFHEAYKEWEKADALRTHENVSQRPEE